MTVTMHCVPAHRNNRAPFTLVLNLIVPGPPWRNLVMSWAADYSPSSSSVGGSHSRGHTPRTSHAGRCGDDSHKQWAFPCPASNSTSRCAALITPHMTSTSSLLLVCEAVSYNLATANTAALCLERHLALVVVPIACPSKPGEPSLVLLFVSMRQGTGQHENGKCVVLQSCSTGRSSLLCRTFEMRRELV